MSLRTSVRNAWAVAFGAVEERAELPTSVLEAGPHRTLRRYEPDAPASGRPILLVPPLAVSISCYDLRPGQSLAAHLRSTGRPVYVVDYGPITFADRAMGFEAWVTDIVPRAIERVSAEHGGEQVDVLGWSLGGTILYLTLAHAPGLPVRSAVTLGTPVDYAKVPMAALARIARAVAGGGLVAAPAAVFGGVPRHVVRAAYRLTAPQRELTKPWFVLRNLLDTEALARMQAIDRFQSEMPGYPGRLYLQMVERLILRLELKHGVVRLSDELTIDLAKLAVPVQVVGSRTDVIAPAAAVRPAVEVLTGSPEVRYAEVETSHLGLVAGSVAPETVWPVVDEFLARD